MENFQKKILKHKIRNLPNLPTLPANVIMTLNYLREPEVDIRKVVAAVSRDQIILAQIMKLINSGFYGLRAKVESVGHAVNLLGVNKLKELLLTVSVMEPLAHKDPQLWFHAYSSFRLMTTLLADCPELGVAANLPLTMLMHDIGQVVLERLNPVSHRIAVESSHANDKALFHFEQKLLGVDHGEAGGWLMEFWEMPEDITVPIACHHSTDIPPKFVRETVLVKIVDAIDCAVRSIPHEFPPDAWLDAAGIAEFDHEFWIGEHAQSVEKLDASNPAIGENTQKIKRQTASAAPVK